MAPIFASPDIAALVSAFPPPLPTKDRPSLVRSNSGSNLLDSRKILANFRLLLETSPGRIRKADLPSRLGIEQADWIFECYDGDMHYSKDLQCLLTGQESREVLEQLRTQARDEFVELAGFSRSYDISRPTCDRLVEEVGLRTFRLVDDGQVVGDKSLIDGLNQRILAVTAEANGEKVDLNSLHAAVPDMVLMALATEVLEKHGRSGSLERENERVMYVPGDYHDVQDKKREQEHASKAEAAGRDLSINGFCDVTNDDTNSERSLALEVTANFQEVHREVELITLDQSASTSTSVIVVAKKSSVDQAMTELDQIVTDLAKTSRQSGRLATSLQAFETDLCDATSRLGLTKRLLRSNQYRGALQATLISANQAVGDEDSRQFASICQNTLLSPLELYQQGLQRVPDPTLNERLSGYICEYLRNEIVPLLTQKVRAAGLLHDKTRAKEMERLTAACAQAKTVADLQSAASKFGKKTKISTPDAQQLSQIKLEILRQRLEDLLKTSRGSDVLINLIWILLAQQCNGLLMSAGKDTSRMIKHYQSIGDAETSRKLEHWRDVLKAGTQSNEDVQQMKRMAAEVVENMLGGQAAEAGH